MSNATETRNPEDPIVQEIRQWNREFRGGHQDKPVFKDGIPFWWVGWNASHSFYAGTKGGKRYQYSVGEAAPPDDDWDGDRDGPPEQEECIEEVADFNGYYGHF